MNTEVAVNLKDSLTQSLVDLRLPTIKQIYEEVALQATKNSISYEQYLHDLLVTECDERWNKKRQRLLRESQLPLEKSWSSFNQKRLRIKRLSSTF